jgi:hypothetical protein
VLSERCAPRIQSAEAMIAIVHCGDNPVPPEMFKCPLSGRPSYSFPRGIIFEKLEDRFGHSVTIILLDE